MKLLPWAGVWTCLRWHVWILSTIPGVIFHPRRESFDFFPSTFGCKYKFWRWHGLEWGFTVSNHLKCIFVWDFTGYLWRIFLVLRTIKQLHGSPAFWCVIAWWFSDSSRCDVPKNVGGMCQLGDMSIKCISLRVGDVGWSCVHHKVNMWCTITLYLFVWYIRLWYVICVSYWFWHVLFTCVIIRIYIRDWQTGKQTYHIFFLKSRRVGRLFFHMWASILNCYPQRNVS